jgi:transcriptional regulator with XRE-family HTH domain
MAQDELAKRVGFTVLDLQKYEAGENPIPVSSLSDIALAMDVHINSFFEGLEGPVASDREKRAVILLEQEAMQFVRAYYGLPPDERKEVLDLVRTLWDAAG